MLRHVVRLALGLAGVLLVFASSRANAEEACAPGAPQAELFTNAIGVCDEPGFAAPQPAPLPQPARAPVTCEGPTCHPQQAPLDATGAHALSFQSPLAILGTTLEDPEAEGYLVSSDAGGPCAGFISRIDRPPRSFGSR